MTSDGGREWRVECTKCSKWRSLTRLQHPSSETGLRPYRCSTYWHDEETGEKWYCGENLESLCHETEDYLERKEEKKHNPRRKSISHISAEEQFKLDYEKGRKIRCGGCKNNVWTERVRENGWCCYQVLKKDREARVKYCGRELKRECRAGLKKMEEQEEKEPEAAEASYANAQTREDRISRWVDESSGAR